MPERHPAQPTPKPYPTADQIPQGSPYELSGGALVFRDNAGGRHAQKNEIGASALASDPDVTEAGVDAGYSPRPDVLRAPDIAIGNVPNQPGWVKGAPALAVEYADIGQDETDLQIKIRELLRAGTKFFWVVRLTGPRRVEVYEPGKAMRTVAPGATLTAPGVLKNPVQVEALYDRDAAHRATLVNLLQRRGYADLDAVLAEGEAKGLRAAVRDLCEVLAIEVTPAREQALRTMTAGDLDALRQQIKRERRWG